MSYSKRIVRRSKRTNNKINKKTRKLNRIRRKFRGGEIVNISDLDPSLENAVKPFKSYGFNGASSASEAAYNHSVSSRENQQALNKLSGGASVIEVPSFAPIGGIKMAYTLTDSSKATNLASLVGKNDATNDCFVLDNCNVTNTLGGSKSRRRSRSRRSRRSRRCRSKSKRRRSRRHRQNY